MTAEKQQWNRAMNALLLEVDSSIVDDIRKKGEEYMIAIVKECAERATIDCDEGSGNETWWVDRSSIMDVIKDIK